MRDTLATYYQLTKPGIIRGNLLTAIAGFCLAASQPGNHFRFDIFVAMAAGLALVVASACVLNNYTDRYIDAKMDRTSKRALATGTIRIRYALAYCIALGLVGVALLLWFTNLLTAGLAISGFLAYVGLYGWAKRATIHGTLVGTISGAIPPVVGYTAVTSNLDAAALLLFIILVCWQMPHFYAIAIYRLKDYKAANIPVRPAVTSIADTRHHIIGWCIALALVSPMLHAFGYIGVIAAVFVTLVSLGWLTLNLVSDFSNHDRWAKRVFVRSLLVILLLCIGIAAGNTLP